MPYILLKICYKLISSIINKTKRKFQDFQELLLTFQGLFRPRIIIFQRTFKNFPKFSRTVHGTLHPAIAFFTISPLVRNVHYFAIHKPFNPVLPSKIWYTCITLSRASIKPVSFPKAVITNALYLRWTDKIVST